MYNIYYIDGFTHSLHDFFDVSTFLIYSFLYFLAKSVLPFFLINFFLHSLSDFTSAYSLIIGVSSNPVISYF